MFRGLGDIPLNSLPVKVDTPEAGVRLAYPSAANSPNSSIAREATPDVIPRRAHPNVLLVRRGQDHWHSLRMDWLDYGVRRGLQETIDLMRPSCTGFELVPRFPLNGVPDASECG
jgi:hypothetical protein